MPAVEIEKKVVIRLEEWEASWLLAQFQNLMPDDSDDDKKNKYMIHEALYRAGIR